MSLAWEEEMQEELRKKEGLQHGACHMGIGTMGLTGHGDASVG